MHSSLVKLVVGASSCAAAAALVAVPSFGSTNPPAVDIRADKQFVVVHNIELVGASGYTLGEQLTLQVFRGAAADGTGGVPIAHVSEPAYDVEGSPGLEVNHGPGAEIRPGDCFDVVTPNVRPGDLVKVTDSAGGVDSAFIDNITVDSITDPTPADPEGDVVVSGQAQSIVGGVATDFTDPDFLNSGFWRGPGPTGVDSRGEFPDVVLNGDGTYTATYSEGERNWGQFRPVIAGGGQPVDKDTVLNAGHEFGYGHAEIDINGNPIPPAKEVQLVEVAGAGGGPIVQDGEGVPVLGCEGQSRASTSNDITAVDDKVVNLTSGGLVVSGPAETGVTQVDVTLADASAGTVTKTNVDRVSGFDGQAWRAEFTEAEVQGLADGTLTATATFTGTGPVTATRDIPKDTTPPAQPPTDPPATGGGGGAGGAAGGATGTTTGGGTTTVGGTQTTPIDPALLQVSNVRTRSRISRRGARRNGVAASFLVPDGARVLRVELHSTDRARAARLIGIKDVALSAGGRQVVRLNSRRTRGLLRPGLYRLVIQVGDGSQLGPRVVKRIRVVR